MIPMIVRVWCESGAGWAPTHVPVTPHTSCRDVLECCREPGDEPCLLFSVHPQHGVHVLRDTELPLEVASALGPDVQFVLKYIDETGSTDKSNGMKEPGSPEELYWAEKKCALKKQCAEVSASMRRTGGGTADNLPTLSALDNRLVAVMGGQEFATGDARWTVNPFPQSTIPTESPVVIEHIDTVQEDTAMDSIRNMSPIPSTSQNDAIPATSTIPVPRTPLPSATPPRPRRRRTSIRRSLDSDMEQMTRIEARRVEAELLTAQALTQMSENFSNITIALTSIANAISDVARKMPNP